MSANARAMDVLCGDDMEGCSSTEAIFLVFEIDHERELRENLKFGVFSGSSRWMGLMLHTSDLSRASVSTVFSPNLKICVANLC